MNELRHYDAGQSPARAGFKTILAGPAHPDYASFCPAPGHGLGINDLKVIEVRNLVRAIECGEPFQPDFDEGLRVQKIMEAIEQSSREQAWIEPDLSF
jgi:predicted dehydrogenase